MWRQFCAYSVHQILDKEEGDSGVTEDRDEEARPGASDREREQQKDRIAA
jgi:hypothetical protein